MIGTAWYGLVLLNCAFVASTDGTCSKFWKDSTVITKDSKYNLKANVSATENTFKSGTVVQLSCLIQNQVLVGSGISKCFNGNWDNKPECQYKVVAHDNTLPWDIIGGSVGGGVAFITIVVVVLVLVCRKKKQNNNKSRQRNDMNTTDRSVPFNDLRYSHFPENHTNRQTDSGLYHEVHAGDEAKRMYYNMQTRNDSHYASAGSIDVYRNHDGVSLIGSTESVLGVSNIPLFKVWTCRRTRRKFIRAENLANLQRKAAAIYQYDNPVRFTLEEDGTEIDNDEVLASCAGKTLLVLTGNEHWTDPNGKAENIPTQKYTLDVCSHDRTIRKLILAENLKDLIHQAPAYFGYSVKEICLEKDGTSIDDDATLILISSQIMMALGRDHDWTAKVHDVPLLRAGEQNNGEALSDSTFKVWTEDLTIKKIVRAYNCIDLHIKAASALGLEMPIQIRVKDDDTVVSTDNILKSNAGKILIAVQKSPPRLVGETTAPLNDSKYEHHNYTNQNQDYPYARVNSVQKRDHEQQLHYPIGQRENTQYYPGADANNSLFERRKGSTDYYNKDSFTPNPVNHPDVVKSSQSSSLIPSRYEPSPKLHNKDTASSNPHLQGGNYQPYQTDANARTRPNDTDYIHDLPYSDLTPSKQMNFGTPRTPKQESVVEDHELPYSDLKPSHRKGQKVNNFDMMRQQQGTAETEQKQDSADFDNNRERRQSPLIRQPSFLVTGGAKQSNHSDVLF